MRDGPFCQPDRSVNRTVLSTGPFCPFSTLLTSDWTILNKDRKFLGHQTKTLTQLKIGARLSPLVRQVFNCFRWMVRGRGYALLQFEFEIFSKNFAQRGLKMIVQLWASYFLLFKNLRRISCKNGYRVKTDFV